MGDETGPTTRGRIAPHGFCGPGRYHEAGGTEKPLATPPGRFLRHGATKQT